MIMTMTSLTVDKHNNDCLYNDEKHIYWDKNTQATFTSVTTLIGLYAHQFDSEFWGSYKAMEALMTPEDFAILKRTLLANKKFNPIFVRKFGIDEEVFFNKKSEILLSYDVERDKSCERGNKIHAEYERRFDKEGAQNLKHLGLPNDFICRPNNYELDLDRGIYPEYLIHRTSEDGALRIAGQIDLLIKDGNDIYLRDYKTNKEIKQKSYWNKNKRSYECMKFPLNHIMDTNYWHYVLQLSLYAYLLQQVNPEFNIKSLKLLHIDHDNNETEYELEYMKDAVEKMLQHYKRQLKSTAQLNKIAPIKY